MRNQGRLMNKESAPHQDECEGIFINIYEGIGICGAKWIARC